jgi:hypothetical protein
MSDVTNEVVEIFYYYNLEGKKCYTPNAEFAEVQARNYGTDNVYVEKY